MTCYIPVLVKRKINKNTKTKKTDKTSAVAEKYQWHHATHDNGEHSSASQIYVEHIDYCYVCMCIRMCVYICMGYYVSWNMNRDRGTLVCEADRGFVLYVCSVSIVCVDF